MAVAVASSWPQLEGLQRLHLGGNDITDDGARGDPMGPGRTYGEVPICCDSCASSFDNYRLESAFFGPCRLTDLTVSFCPGKEPSGPLQSRSSCFAGVAALTAAIQAHHPSRPYKLRRLNLRGNNLGPASVQAVTRVCDEMSTRAKLSELSALALVLMHMVRVSTSDMI